MIAGWVLDLISDKVYFSLLFDSTASGLGVVSVCELSADADALDDQDDFWWRVEPTAYLLN